MIPLHLCSPIELCIAEGAQPGSGEQPSSLQRGAVFCNWTELGSRLWALRPDPGRRRPGVLTAICCGL